MKISIIVMQSLDGYIAKSHSDDLSWGSRADREFFSSKTKQIGTMIMGSTTFEAMKGVKGTAFKDRRIVVMTSRPEVYTCYSNDLAKGIDFISGTPNEIVEQIAVKGIKEACVVGGGKVIQQFIKSGLVDELFVTIAPVIFGEGISVCEGGIGQVNLELLDFNNLSENEMVLHYKITH